MKKKAAVDHTDEKSPQTKLSWWRWGADKTDALIAALAMGVRFWHVFLLARSPFSRYLAGDAATYSSWAERILQGDLASLHQGVFYQSPLYPYVLAGIFAVFGKQNLAVFCVQALFGVLSCVLVARAARVLFSPAAGLLAGTLLALYGPGVYFEGLLQKAALDGFLVASLWWLWSRVVVLGGWYQWWAAGLCCGLLTLNRENALVLGLGVVAAAFFCQSGALTPKRRVLAALLGLLLPLLPVAVRNAWIGGGVHLTTAQFGPNFYIGNHPNASGLYEPLVAGRGSPDFERLDARRLAEAELGRDITDGEVSRFWAVKAFAFIFGQPLTWAVLFAKKILLTVNGVEIADVDDFYGRSRMFLQLKLAFVRFPLIFALGVWGWVQSRARWRELFPVFFGVPLYVLSVAVFFVMARYRYPLAILLAPFAAWGMVQLWAAGKARGRPWLAWVVVSAGFGLSLLPLVERRWQEASTFVSLGDYFLNQEKNPSEAVSHYRKASQLAPESAEAQFRLAEALVALDQREEAERAFAEAARLAPVWAEVYLKWGQARLSWGQEAAALAVFSQAAQFPETAGPALRLLGDVWFKLGRLEEAFAAYQKAWGLGKDATLANNMGALLARQGRFQEAEQWFLQACELDPAYAQPWVNIAKLRLRAQDTAKAAQALEKALSLEPGHREAQELLRRLASPGSR